MSEQVSTPVQDQPPEEQVMEAPIAPTEAPLNALDRCDRCQAQAYVKTRHPFVNTDKQQDEADLLWCAHHYRAHQDKLREFVVLDETSKLDVKLEAAAY